MLTRSFYELFAHENEEYAIQSTAMEKDNGCTDLRITFFKIVPDLKKHSKGSQTLQLEPLSDKDFYIHRGIPTKLASHSRKLHAEAECED